MAVQSATHAAITTNALVEPRAYNDPSAGLTCDLLQWRLLEERKQVCDLATSIIIDTSPAREVGGDSATQALINQLFGSPRLRDRGVCYQAAILDRIGFQTIFLTIGHSGALIVARRLHLRVHRPGRAAD